MFRLTYFIRFGNYLVLFVTLKHAIFLWSSIKFTGQSQLGAILFSPQIIHIVEFKHCLQPN